MSGTTVWTFGLSTFTRILQGGEFEPWFQAKGIYQKDVVLGATVAADSYIDTGAVEVGPLTIRARFDNTIDRDVFMGQLLAAGTLSNSKGYSGSAILLAANAIDSGLPDLFYVDATFELR